MYSPFHTVIIGSGAYLPTRVVKNSDFLDSEFYSSNQERNPRSNADIVDKMERITEICERRYVQDEFTASDIGFFAAEDAIISSGIDRETLDYIIVAHNFGDVKAHNRRSDMVPSLASRIKHKLGIVNSDCVAYDLPFGCPGWVQGMIQANYYIKSGDAKRVMVIGTETLSRVSDPHDIDSMLYSDGSGATIVEAVESSEPVGILSHKTRTDTFSQYKFLWMDDSYNPNFEGNDQFLKMKGRKIYEYAVSNIPGVIEIALEKAGVSIRQIKKVLMHQANGKMNKAIISRILRDFNVDTDPETILPLAISKIGNNSVATVPILYDMVTKGKMENHQIQPNDHLILASVGAGMNINAIVYKAPVN